jgi:gluconolactonase
MRNLFVITLFICIRANAQDSTFRAHVPDFYNIVDTTIPLKRIASGFGFLEGPLWTKEGYLIFSDLRVNKIFKLDGNGKVSVFLNHSGYKGAYDTSMREDYGSDALAYDKNGHLLVCQHGNHAISVLVNGHFRTLVNSYKGKRLNSPDDLVVKSDGSIYFTDPPYIFRRMDADPGKVLKVNGIYRYNKGKLTLLSDDYRYPNGITFSPDEQYLYVCSYGREEPVRKYKLSSNGSLKKGDVISTLNGDGLKTDRQGNLYLCNYEGIHVLTSDGRELGLIKCPEGVTNINWGEDDRKTLFIVAQGSVYKVRMKVPGRK